MSHILIFLTDFIQNNLQFVLLIAFLASVAEGVVIVSMVPGSTVVLLLGAFAARGVVPFSQLFFVVFLGATIGGMIGFWLGQKYGSKILRSQYVDEKYYFLAQDFIKQKGKIAIFLSRFISGLKEFAPFIAGSLSMNKTVFWIWNFISCFGWTVLFLGGGYFFGNDLESVSGIFKMIGFIAAIGFFSLGAIYYLQRDKIV